uniref:RHS repeat domain-containing protein n=1 Tax=uncultured Akkermansia sp. TaxID=512294 RepID=UPI002604EFE8
ADGSKTEYEYTTAGKLVKITDAAGNVQEFTVNGNGFDLTETDWMGNTTSTATRASIVLPSASRAAPRISCVSKSTTISTVPPVICPSW